jgi:hypothetical protein
MQTAFERQLAARVDLAMYRCGLGEDYLTDARHACMESGMNGDRPTAFLLGEPELVGSFNDGVRMREAAAADDCEWDW